VKTFSCFVLTFKKTNCFACHRSAAVGADAAVGGDSFEVESDGGVLGCQLTGRSRQQLEVLNVEGAATTAPRLPVPPLTTGDRVL